MGNLRILSVCVSESTVLIAEQQNMVTLDMPFTAAQNLCPYLDLGGDEALTLCYSGHHETSILTWEPLRL